MGRPGYGKTEEDLCYFLYVDQILDYPLVAKKTGISERKIRQWGKDNNWRNARKEKLKQRSRLDADLYDLASEITVAIKDTLKAGDMPAQALMYLLPALLGKLDNVKKYEDSIFMEQLGEELENKKEITEDRFLEIRAKTLGF